MGWTEGTSIKYIYEEQLLLLVVNKFEKHKSTVVGHTSKLAANKIRLMEDFILESEVIPIKLKRQPPGYHGQKRVTQSRTYRPVEMNVVEQTEHKMEPTVYTRPLEDLFNL